MGVRGLQYYLELCCQSASPTVNIKELALRRRRRRGNERLIIVLDGSSCMTFLYDDLEWIGGGQLNQYAEKFDINFNLLQRDIVTDLYLDVLLGMGFTQCIDSDYVILDIGDAHYLSMEHLNINEMTTRLYDRWELANHLRIQPNQLPLLATLMGNDIIPFADLGNFHRRIVPQRFPSRRVDFSKSVPNIAMYICRLPVSLDESSLCSKISIDVFGHPYRKEDIRRSIKSYTTQSTIGIDRGASTRWTQLVALARRRHQQNELPSSVYAIMNELPFESSTSVEDFRLNDIPFFACVTQPIRERAYGILLLEKPTPRSGHHLVPEWCMAGPNSLDQVKYVRAVPPQGGHPGLQELWREGPNTLELRWTLFVKSVSPNLDVKSVRDLPKHLLVPTLIMFYLREYRCLNEFEIDAVLSTAASLKHYDGWSLSELPADPMTSRSIRVGNLYMRITFVIYFLQAACGYPITVQQTAPWQFFDGKLFQMKYRFAEQGMTHFQLCENKRQVLEEFLLARSIVFNQN